MARIPLTWYPEPGTWHHSHISNLNGALLITPYSSLVTPVCIPHIPWGRFSEHEPGILPVSRPSLPVSVFDTVAGFQIPGTGHLGPGTGSTPRAGHRAPRTELNTHTGFASCILHLASCILSVIAPGRISHPLDIWDGRVRFGGKIMQVLILTAGYGLRLRPLTLVYPKALVPILNVPLLQLQLDRLHGDDRVREVYVNRHYLADRYPPPTAWAGPVPVRYLDEADFPYGTGGAIRNLWDVTGQPDDVLVLNGDSLGLVSLSAFLDFAWGVDADAVLYVRGADAAPAAYTRLFMDSTTARLFPSETPGRVPVLYAGMALLRVSALRYLPTEFPSDWFRDAVAPAWQAGTLRLVGYRDDAPWWDFGDADRFLETYGDLVRAWQAQPAAFGPLRDRLEAAGTWRRPGLWVHPTADVAADVIVEDWCVVGPQSHVEGAVLRTSVLDRSVRVRRARMSRVFVGPDVVLEGLDIEDAVVATDAAGTLQTWTW
jgi:NDP-sugar pyrophosphorylase family protein